MERKEMDETEKIYWTKNVLQQHYPPMYCTIYWVISQRYQTIWESFMVQMCLHSLSKNFSFWIWTRGVFLKNQTLIIIKIDHSNELFEMDNMTRHKETWSPGLLSVFHLDLPRMNSMQDGADDRGESEPCNWTIASRDSPKVVHFSSKIEFSFWAEKVMTADSTIVNYRRWWIMHLSRLQYQHLL